MFYKKLLAVVLVLSLASCCHKSRKEGARCCGSKAKKEAEAKLEAKPEISVSEANVFFEFDSVNISQEERKTLDETILPELKANKNSKVRIEGHTDERGSEAYNMKLGEKRAEEVKVYLVNKGIDPNRIEVKSFGETVPLDPGHNKEAWAKNRRVVTVSVK